MTLGRSTRRHALATADGRALIASLRDAASGPPAYAAAWAR
ncbi:MAG: hypothetical protein ACRYHQ_26030 [Janthinobacterium lividum]